MSFSSNLENGRLSAALYVAGAVGQSAGLYAVSFQNTVPAFAAVSIGTTFLGAMSAFLMRQRGASRDLVRVGALVLAVLFLLLVVLFSRFGAYLPFIVYTGSNDTVLVLALALTATFGAFFWFSDEAIIFSSVWSVAMIGLTATTNLNLPVIVCFAIFLCAALFVLVHQHGLAQSVGRVGVTPERGALLKWQAITAVALWLVTMIAGVVVAVPLQMVGRNMSLGAILERLKMQDNRRNRQQRRLRLLFENPDQFAVGLGPTQDDDTLVMRVRADRPAYWRAHTFAVCEGTVWSAIPGDMPGATMAPTSENGTVYTYRLTPGLEGQRDKVAPLHAEFQPQVSTRSMYHAAEPREIQCAAQVILRRNDGTAGPREVVGNYTVNSEISVATPEDLNASSTNYSDDILQRYLQEPSPGLLDQLAREAIGNAKGPYDKAEAIRKFVANRCTYSLDAKPCPPGRNPAEWFLNESRVGYCDLYATSTTLLCRAAGIPARVVTGFNVGEASPDQPGVYELRERNRHAWTEVFFTGYGWIPFDATVSTLEGTTTPQAAQPVRRTQKRGLSPGPLALIGVAVLGLGYVGMTELLRRRRLGVSGGQVQQNPYQRQVLASYRTALQLLKKRGVLRNAPMTAGEHLQEVDGALGTAVARAYQELVLLHNRALFDRQPLGAADAERAAQALASLRTLLAQKEPTRGA